MSNGIAELYHNCLCTVSVEPVPMRMTTPQKVSPPTDDYYRERRIAEQNQQLAKLMDQKAQEYQYGELEKSLDAGSLSAYIARQNALAAKLEAEYKAHFFKPFVESSQWTRDEIEKPVLTVKEEAKRRAKSLSKPVIETDPQVIDIDWPQPQIVAMPAAPEDPRSQQLAKAFAIPAFHHTDVHERIMPYRGPDNG